MECRLLPNPHCLLLGKFYRSYKITGCRKKFQKSRFAHPPQVLPSMVSTPTLPSSQSCSWGENIHFEIKNWGEATFITTSHRLSLCFLCLSGTSTMLSVLESALSTEARATVFYLSPLWDCALDPSPWPFLVPSRLQLLP